MNSGNLTKFEWSRWLWNLVKSITSLVNRSNDNRNHIVIYIKCTWKVHSLQWRIDKINSIDHLILRSIIYPIVAHIILIIKSYCSLIVKQFVILNLLIISFSLCKENRSCGSLFAISKYCQSHFHIEQIISSFYIWWVLIWQYISFSNM